MSFWSRIANVFRGDRLSREIDEELQSHIAEAIEQGRDPAEARRAFGSALRQREESRDIRARRLARFAPRRRRLRLAAAHEEQGDLRRGDPVAGPRRSAPAPRHSGSSTRCCCGPCRWPSPSGCTSLARQGIGFDGKLQTFDGWAYPVFRQMRAAVKDQAELIAISYAERTDLTYGSDQEMEKAYRAIRFRLDVRLVRTPARAGAAVHRKRRSRSPARIPTPCSRTTIGRAASGRIRK